MTATSTTAYPEGAGTNGSSSADQHHKEISGRSRPVEILSLLQERYDVPPDIVRCRLRESVRWAACRIVDDVVRGNTRGGIAYGVLYHIENTNWLG